MSNTKKRLNTINNLYKIYRFRKDPFEFIESYTQFNSEIVTHHEYYYFRVNLETNITNHAYTAIMTEDIRSCLKFIKEDMRKSQQKKSYLNHLLSSKLKKEFDDSPIMKKEASKLIIGSAIKTAMEIDKYISEKCKKLRPKIKSSYILNKIKKIDDLEKKYDIIIGERQKDRVSNTKKGETLFKQFSKNRRVNL